MAPTRKTHKRRSAHKKDGAVAAQARRMSALEGIKALQASVRPSPKMRRLSPEEQEDAILAMLEEDD